MLREQNSRVGETEQKVSAKSYCCGGEWKRVLESSEYERRVTVQVTVQGTGLSHKANEIKKVASGEKGRKR